MLILCRNTNQSIVINNDIKITVLGIIDNKVRVGIEAPKEIPVDREEVHLKKLQEV